jgi:type III pantothenate kinase
MLLAIDAGNTNVVFAVYEADQRRGMWRAATDPRRTGDEYAVWLTQLMGTVGLTPSAITDCIIASVVPTATFNLLKLSREHFRVEPLVVGESAAGGLPVELGIQVRMDRPEEVGADRLVNAVAAAERYGGPLIVVDFGTATTFDVVDAAGDYRGGVIAPGINLSLEALHMAAAKLPKIEVAKPRHGSVIGTNTVAAMQSGVYWGYVGLIEGLLVRLKNEMQAFGSDRVPKVIATGGLAVLFAEATDAIETIDEDLTLRGLVLLQRRNQVASARTPNMKSTS